MGVPPMVAVRRDFDRYADRSCKSAAVFGMAAQQMRILSFGHTARLGGGEIALLNTLKAMPRDRFEVIVVLASDGPLVAMLREAGFSRLTWQEYVSPRT